jgi:hypothetical protein
MAQQKEPWRLPKYLYHATPIKNLASIIEEGLIPPKKINPKLLSDFNKHTDRVFLSRYSDPREMFLPDEKLDQRLAILKIETQYLKKECMYPDDSLYLAYANGNLSVETEQRLFPEITKKFIRKFGIDHSAKEWEEFIIEHGYTDDKIEEYWKGKGYLTLNNMIPNDSFDLGEMGYACKIPPSAISIFKYYESHKLKGGTLFSKTFIIKNTEREEEMPTNIGYHATSCENAQSILENGFELEYSDEMFFGLGIYLSYSKEDVMYYKERWDQISKGVILKVVIPSDVEWCRVNQIMGIGTFQQYLKDRRRNQSHYLNQIEERFIEDRLSKFPTVYCNYYLNRLELLDDSEEDKRTNWEKWRELFITLINEEYPVIKDLMLEDIESIGDLNEIRKRLDEKKAKKFLKLMKRLDCEFEFSESSFEDFVRKDYHSLAEDYAECDVEFSTSQIIIHSEEVLKKVEVMIEEPL